MNFEDHIEVLEDKKVIIDLNTLTEEYKIDDHSSIRKVIKYTIIMVRIKYGKDTEIVLKNRPEDESDMGKFILDLHVNAVAGSILENWEALDD